MREIEFLPDCYRKGRQRQIGYRTQYAFLALLIMLIAIWELSSGRNIANARAQLAGLESTQKELSDQLAEFENLTQKISNMKNHAQILEKLDSDISVSSVIAELSYLLSKQIKLDKLLLVSEVIENTNENVPGQLRSVSKVKESAHTKNVAFQIKLQGTALDAAAVAQVICMLEDSAYFNRVTPVFSRDKTLNNSKDKAGSTVTEFEISCYLANCRIEESL